MLPIKQLSWLGCFFLLAAPSWAQEEEAPPADEEPTNKPRIVGYEPKTTEIKIPEGMQALPAPFQRIASNSTELRAGGMLTITRMRYEYIDEAGQMGIIWTLRANRKVTFSHLRTLVRLWRDARFYHQGTKGRVLLHTTVLGYPGWLDQGAGSREFLGEGQTIEFWLPMTPSERRKVNAQEANRLVLGPRSKKFRRFPQNPSSLKKYFSGADR